MEVRIKRLSEDVQLPTYGSEESAGCDIRAFMDYPVDVKPHETVKFPTGFATDMNKGTVGLVFSRSGLATKQGLRVCQGVAVIDSDYRGEWFVPLTNDSDETRIVNPNDRIAQVIFMEYPTVQLKEVNELYVSQRGAGGFGSTGTV